MAAVIDTSVLVAAERGRLDLAEFLASHPDESFAVSAITWSELWHGVFRADGTKRRELRQAFVRSVGEIFPVLPFDSTVAEVHASTWASLARRGAMIGAHDLIVAATALATSASVVTRNSKEFARVQGLRVVTV